MAYPQENRRSKISGAFGLVPLALASALGMAVAGCGVEGQLQQIADEFGTGYIEGRAESSDANGRGAPGIRTAAEAEASGQVVVVGRIDSSGSFIEKGESTVDASGQYRIAVDLSRGPASDLVVRVQEDGETTGSVIVSGEAAAGTTVHAAPIDMETTVEAEAYASARSQGSWEDREGSSALLRAHISAEVAADVQSSSDTEADVVALGQAASAAIKARSEAFLDARVGVSESALETAMEARTQARADLDAALHAAAGAEAEADAHAGYEDAVVDAYADASITLEQQSRAAYAGAEAFLVFSGELSTDAEAGATAEAELLRAKAAAALVEAQMTAAEVQADGQAAIEAAVETLHAEIEAAARAGANAEADIRTSWSDFSASVVAELKASMEAGEATAFETVESIVTQAQDTLKQALDLVALVSVDAAAESSASAVLDGYAKITAASTVQVMTNADMGGARAEAVVEIYAAASLAAR